MIAKKGYGSRANVEYSEMTHQKEEHRGEVAIEEPWELRAAYGHKSRKKTSIIRYAAKQNASLKSCKGKNGSRGHRVYRYPQKAKSSSKPFRLGLFDVRSDQGFQPTKAYSAPPYHWVVSCIPCGPGHSGQRQCPSCA